MTTGGTTGRIDAVREKLNVIAANLDATIGSGVSPEPSGPSRAELERDFGLVHKFLTALDIGQPGLVDSDEFDRLVARYT